ncbi:uncharacterized protein LOC110460332 [Mizuhopecten yessoensis]|uniref:Uncharacterized protein n=1 Tax=Mizuhopecten yessoensis TaxID=6573 RepID=A0A210R323_MIZYE|nr:uncharacterized protein LOC110460332 [Mizuhopecten yessoensis]XP_021368865.1 uncharacterized protein LOC110460332 [Mizuhopecten yessoensis]OWF55428.1 hypothetical protein KP79_PYT10459 [Mizuhopecten yessoensis]
MKEPKMLAGSICDHGRRRHKRVSSAKGRRAPSTAKPAQSVANTKGPHVVQVDVTSPQKGTSETEQQGAPEFHGADEDKSLTHNTDVPNDDGDVIQETVSEMENTDLVSSETNETKSDIPMQKQHIVVNMNIQDLDEGLEGSLEGGLEDDDVFESDIKNSQDENKYRKRKPLTRDHKKDKDLKPINECDESGIITTENGDQETEKAEEVTATTYTNYQVSLPVNGDVETKLTVDIDKVKRHTIKRPKSEKFRRPKSSTVSDKQKRRPLSSMVSGRPSSASGGTSRCTIVPTLRVTKAELEYYLPKRSFFSCHDKALKDAGYGTGKTPRQTRMIEAWAKQTENKTFGERVPTPQDMENSLDSDKQHTAVEELGDDAKQRHPSESLSEAGSRESVSSTVAQLHDHRLSRQVSNISIRSNASLTRKLSRLSRRRGDNEDDEIRVDFQPLLQYLKHISENPDDYVHQHKQWKAGVPSQDSLVKLGNIYRRGRHGPSSDSTLVNAVHDINPRFSDPSQWTNTNKEKTLLTLTSSKRDSSQFLSKIELHDSGTSSDEPKSEFDKIKHKMEAWLKTVTTAQLVKAKELALRELGEEDASQSRWWVSLKSCYYLR